MLTWRTLRGTSCLWMKARKCLWIGIRPSGEGDLENSCQLQAAVDPFVLAGDSRDGSCSLGTPLPVESFLEGCFLWRTGERLFGRGLRPVATSMDSSDEDSCSSTKISCLFPCSCALDLVVGAVYPASDPDSGAGLGEVTLGVAGVVL